MLTVLIADDESPARNKLKHQLDYCEGVKLIAEATDGEDAIKKINRFKPDVVLLDVKMPYMNGIDVLDVIEHPCSVIFTTAYDQFAIKAFEKAALDYLLKPFSLQRLKVALARVTIQPEVCLNNKPLSSRVGDKIRLVPLEEVTVLTAESGLTYATTLNQLYPVDYSLDELETKLPAHFVRVHRGCIANIHHISEVQRWLNSNLLLKFKDINVEVTTSRNGTQKLKHCLDL